MRIKRYFFGMSLTCVLCLYGIASAKTCEEWWSWFKAGGDIGDRSQDVYEIAKECMSRVSVKPLLELLKNDTDGNIRATAATGLGFVAEGDSSIKKDMKVIDALYGAMKDNSMGVRVESAAILDKWNLADTSIVLNPLFDIARGVGKKNWFKDGCRNCYGGDTSESKHYISSMRHRALKQISNIYLKKSNYAPYRKLLFELSSDRDEKVHTFVTNELRDFNTKDTLNTKRGQSK